MNRAFKTGDDRVIVTIGWHTVRVHLSEGKVTAVFRYPVDADKTEFADAKKWAHALKVAKAAIETVLAQKEDYVVFDDDKKKAVRKRK